MTGETTGPARDATARRDTAGNATVEAVRAEWTKIATLRSAIVLLVLTCAVAVALGWLSGWSVGNAFDRGLDVVRPDFHPVTAGHYPLRYAQVLLIAFAVLLVGSEYGSGTIRTSLTAVPSRGRFYLAKVVAGLVPAAVVAVLTAAGGVTATQWGLGRYGVPLDHDDVLPTTLGAVGYLVLMYALCVGVATVLRNTALATSLLVVLVMVLSPLANRVEALRGVARYLPDHAGAQLMTVGAQADPELGPVAGLLILTAWATAALVGGYLALRSRAV
ncbi:ABC transporter permease subunit [Actinosynnema sp. NPDC059797]